MPRNRFRGNMLTRKERPHDRHRQVASAQNLPQGCRGHSGAAIPRLDGSCLRRRAEGARPPRVPLRAERHRHEELERGAGGSAARRAAADPQAARGLPRRHDPGRQPDQQQRAGAARRRRRSRPLCRVVPHRRPGQEDHGRHQGQHLLRPDHRQQDRSRNPLRLARARHGRLAPGRRLRLRAIPAPIPTTWRGAARRSRCRRCSTRACCSNGCSGPA